MGWILDSKNNNNNKESILALDAQIKWSYIEIILEYV